MIIPTADDPMAPFQMAMRKNAETRPCSFDPADLYTPYPSSQGGSIFSNGTQNTGSYLSLSLKQVWLYTYCNEHGIKPRIECDDVKIHMLNPVTGTGIVIAKARIYLDDTLAASDAACKKFSLGDPISLDSAIQMATGNALSRALSSAGFGCISSIDAPAPDSGQTDENIVPTSEGNQKSVTTVPASEGSQQNATASEAPIAPPASFNEEAPCSVPMSEVDDHHISEQQGLPGQQVIPDVEPAGTPPVQNAEPPHPESTVEDEILLAKKTVFLQKEPTGDGLHGKTFEEILAVNPNFIVRLASAKRGKYKKIAMVLLPEAQKKLGLAVTPTT